MRLQNSALGKSSDTSWPVRCAVKAGGLGSSELAIAAVEAVAGVKVKGGGN